MSPYAHSVTEHCCNPSAQTGEYRTLSAAGTLLYKESSLLIYKHNDSITENRAVILQHVNIKFTTGCITLEYLILLLFKNLKIYLMCVSVLPVCVCMCTTVFKEIRRG